MIETEENAKYKCKVYNNLTKLLVSRSKLTFMTTTLLLTDLDNILQEHKQAPPGMTGMLNDIYSNAYHCCYHDFKSDLPFPKMTLVKHLDTAISFCEDAELGKAISNIRSYVLVGKYDDKTDKELSDYYNEIAGGTANNV